MTGDPEVGSTRGGGAGGPRGSRIPGILVAALLPLCPAAPLLGQSSLTIYNDGRVLVRREVEARIAKGASTLQLGLGALELIRACGLDVPLIIVSGTVGEETAVAAIRNGATIEELEEVADVGPVVAASIREFFDDAGHRRVIRELLGHGIEFRKAERRSEALAGQVIVFTGGLETMTRDEAKALAEARRS